MFHLLWYAHEEDDVDVDEKEISKIDNSERNTKLSSLFGSEDTKTNNNILQKEIGCLLVLKLASPHYFQLLIF